MQKAFTTLFAFLFSLCLAQKGKVIYQNINVVGNEGITESVYINSSSKDNFIKLVSNFENSFKTIKNRYPEYYRKYTILNYYSPKRLEIMLYPKHLVSTENKKKFYFWAVPSGTKILRVTYNIKTKEVYGPTETSNDIIVDIMPEPVPPKNKKEK